MRSGFGRRRVVVIAAAAAVAVVAVTVLVAALGGGSSTPDASGDTKRVATTVQAFDAAVIRRDFATVCNSLFTPAARDAAGGAGCSAQLAGGAASLAGAQLQLKAIGLRGDYATATILYTRPGHPALPETLELVRSGGRFLISAATGSPSD